MIARILFLLIGSLGLLAALGTVLARNLIHAALYLVAFFFCVACLFVLLEVEFLAAIQVLVYIGAVIILILFGIMLTRNIQGDETTSGGWTPRLPGVLAALAVLALLLVGIRYERGLGDRPSWTATTARPSDAPGQNLLLNMTPEIGRELMSRYLIAFELTGLLLTIAVVGAIALAYRGLPTEPRENQSPDVTGTDITNTESETAMTGSAR